MSENQKMSEDIKCMLRSMTMVNVKRVLGSKKCCNCVEANSFAQGSYEIRKSVAQQE